MHAIFNHAMRWEFFNRNPISFVRQSAKRIRVPAVLTVEETGKLLGELLEPWRTAVYVAVTTGLRVSELLALKWADIDFAAGEIRLCRGIVRQHIGQMKSGASRKPVPLDTGLAEVLTRWRGCCPYNQDADYIFGSPDKKVSQPYWPNAAMEDHIRPAATRAGIQERIGWHTLRHTFGPLVKSQGADVATTQVLLRHANVSIHDGPLCPSGDTREAGSTISHCGRHSVPKRSHAVDGNGCGCLNRNGRALNSAVECHLHTVEVIGSNPIAPTIHYFLTP